jgi:hypothetical protein
MSTKNPDPQKETLLQDLAERLVRIGWFVAGSENLDGLINFFRQASNDQLNGLIAACDQYIANPPPCRQVQHRPAEPDRSSGRADDASA